LRQGMRLFSRHYSPRCAGGMRFRRCRSPRSLTALGVPQGDQDFLAAVNRALRELEQSGEAQKLFDKWFKPAPAGGRPRCGWRPEAVVRRAATPPGIVVVILKGIFVRGADVSVFTPDGDFVGKGRVTSVFPDQIYVDVKRTSTTA